MRITPMDIREQQFTVKMFRGFDVQEVDTFLEDLAEDYETLLKENQLLKEQLQAMEERARGLEDRERVLQETLVTTQREDGRGGADLGGRRPGAGGRVEAHAPAARGGPPHDHRDVPASARSGAQDR